MRDQDSHDIARALGPPGKLSRFEKDAIFDSLAPERRGWRVGAAVVGAACAVAAVAAFVLIPHRSASESTMTARGSAGLTVVVRCGAREPGDCVVGDRMTIDFGSMPPAGHLGLLARGPDGTIFWYAPDDDAAPTAPLAQRAPSGVLDSVVTVDASYAPGRYELFAIISEAPMSRAEIRELAHGDRLVPRAGVNIQQRTFVVRPGGAP